MCPIHSANIEYQPKGVSAATHQSLSIPELPPAARLTGANVLLLDEPTNHLDLEAITSLNNGLIEFKGVVMFVSRDHQFMQTIANRIIEITPYGVIDKKMSFDEYMESPAVKRLREEMHENMRNRGDTIPI
jgi:ABC-type sulfate/molybdate transport systems ATPase subunit